MTRHGKRGAEPGDGIESPESPRRLIWHALQFWRFALIPLVIWAAVAWVMYPLPSASTLPNPAIPVYTPGAPDQQDMLVLGSTVLVPGTRAAARVVVYDPQSGQPIAGAQLRVALIPRDLVERVPPLSAGDSGAPGDPGLGVEAQADQVYFGTTDAQGTANAQFSVPEHAVGDWALVVDCAGQVGLQRLVRPVEVRRQVVFHLATDRTTYVPGETVHLRVQTLDAATGLPVAGQAITLTVADGRGNRVCAEQTTTSAYGLASGRCELAPRVNEGEYRVAARVEGSTVEHTVVVRADPASALDLEVSPTQHYGVYGEPLTVTVHASSRWGEPVAGSHVVLTGSLAGGAPESTWRTEGETDREGLSALSLSIPNQAKTSDTQSFDVARLHLVARVASGDGHVAKGDCWLPVSAQAIQISVAPESGAIKPGIDNVIEVHTQYPDGRSAQADLTVDIPAAGQRVEVQSDTEGQSRFLYRTVGQGQTLAQEAPLTVTVVARDAEGRSGDTQRTLQVEGGDYHLLLRPDRATYRVGEQMRLEVWTSQGRSALYAPKAAYVDTIRGGQTVSAHSAPLSEGSATIDLELTDELSGWIELHGYMVLRDGVLVRDIQQVWVEPASSLQVTVRSGREWYARDETARVMFDVIGPQGRGTESAISGFLVEDLSEVGWACPTTPDELLRATGGVSRSELVGDGTDSAVALTNSMLPVRAERAVKARPMPQEMVQQLGAVDAVRASRRQVFSGLAERMAWALMAMAGLAGVTALVIVWHGQAFLFGLRTLARGLSAGAVILIVLAGLSVLLAYAGSAVFGPGSIVVLGLGWVGCLLAWLVLSWESHDLYAYTLWALLVGYLAAGMGLSYCVTQGAALTSPFAWAVPAALVVGMLAVYVAGTVLGQRHKRSGSGAAIALILLLLVTAAGVLSAGKPNPPEEPLSGGVQITDAPADTRQGLGPTATAATPQPTQVALSVPTGAALFPPVPLYESPKDSVRVVDAATDPLGQLAADIVLGRTGTYTLHTYARTDAGDAGHADVQLQVRQPLSIDVEVPSALTVGDQVDLPVVLRNASPITQTVQFALAPALWFRVQSAGMGVQRVELPANGSATRYLPVLITESGRQTLSLVAESDLGTDQQSRSAIVLPDGLLTEWMYGGRVGYGQNLEKLRFRVPWSAIRGTDHLTIGLYSGWPSLLDAGLRGVLHKPDMERASGDLSLPEAGTVAMASVLRDAHAERSGSPTAEQREANHRALAYSYQQLLTLESTGSGFSAIAGGQADLYQTAYALMCLSSVARAYPVDPAVIERTAHWLLDKQSEQGTWTVSPLPVTWSDLPHAELPSTAYAVWALTDAGYSQEPQVQESIAHLERYLDKAQDPYTLALVVHALLAYGQQLRQPISPAVESALARLAEMAEVTDELAVWPGVQETLSGAASVGAQSGTADTERTALAVLALLRARTWTELATQGLSWLAENRDPWGTWRSPQATLLALEALSVAVEDGYAMPGGPAEPVVRVAVGDGISQTVHLGSQDAQTVVVDQLAKGYNDIELEADGPGLAVYHALGSYYLPWDQVTLRPLEEEVIQIEVSYSSTSVSVGEIITADVSLRANRPGVVSLAVLELGLAPGLGLVTEDWDSLVASGVIAAYQELPGQVMAYLNDLSGDRTVRFEVRLRARFPMVAKTQLTRAYDLANPRPVSIRQPVEIRVTGPGA